MMRLSVRVAQPEGHRIGANGSGEVIDDGFAGEACAPNLLEHAVAGSQRHRIGPDPGNHGGGYLLILEIVNLAAASVSVGESPLRGLLADLPGGQQRIAFFSPRETAVQNSPRPSLLPLASTARAR